MRLAASGVVAEDPGRKQPRRGQRETAERAPDEVLGPHGMAECLPQQRVRAGRAPGVEQGEIAVLLGCLDEARAAADKATGLLWISAVQLQLLDYFYYTALTVSALYESGSAGEQGREHEGQQHAEAGAQADQRS